MEMHHYNEFGYYEHPAITSKFSSQKGTLLINFNVQIKRVPVPELIFMNQVARCNGLFSTAGLGFRFGLGLKIPVLYKYYGKEIQI